MTQKFVIRERVIGPGKHPLSQHRDKGDNGDTRQFLHLARVDDIWLKVADLADLCLKSDILLEQVGGNSI